MGLMDSLRRAEEDGKALARRGMEKARTGMDDAERAMRRRMRVHPRVASVPAAPAEQRDETKREDPAEGGIISIHGRDVAPEELDKNAA